MPKDSSFQSRWGWDSCCLTGSSVSLITQIMPSCHCSPVTQVHLVANLHSVGDNLYTLTNWPRRLAPRIAGGSAGVETSRSGKYALNPWIGNRSGLFGGKQIKLVDWYYFDSPSATKKEWNKERKEKIQRGFGYGQKTLHWESRSMDFDLYTTTSLICNLFCLFHFSGHKFLHLWNEWFGILTKISLKF